MVDGYKQSDNRYIVSFNDNGVIEESNTATIKPGVDVIKFEKEDVVESPLNMAKSRTEIYEEEMYRYNKGMSSRAGIRASSA